MYNVHKFFDLIYCIDWNSYLNWFIINDLTWKELLLCYLCIRTNRRVTRKSVSIHFFLSVSIPLIFFFFCYFADIYSFRIIPINLLYKFIDVMNFNARRKIGRNEIRSKKVNISDVRVFRRLTAIINHGKNRMTDTTNWNQRKKQIHVKWLINIK